MGCFYTNYTLRGPSQQSVATALAGRSAIVTPEREGCVVVFDGESDKQNFEIIAELASQLSAGFGCPLLAVLNHDDGFLWYQLYVNGELTDEYNSSPNYFNDSGEDDSAPSGGDAAKLCSAFGIDNSQEVTRILTAPTSENSYLFANERHADLASALGISSFGVAGGFELVSVGELPEGLDDDSLLIRTRALAATEPGPLFVPRKAIPGHYKVSFRADPKLTKSIPFGWMPGVWADLQCHELDISKRCLDAIAIYRRELKDLRFAEVGLKALRRVLSINHRDSGGVNLLDGSRCYYCQLIYHKTFHPAINADKEKVSISFTAVFEHDVLSFSNITATPFESLPHHKVIRIESNDITVMYQNFVQHLAKRADKPRPFVDLPSLQAWFDAEQLAILEDRVRKGIFVRMSDHEVEVALGNLPPGHPALRP